MKGVYVGGRFGGSKRLQRKNFGPPWKESHWRLVGGGDRERVSISRIQREVVMQKESRNAGKKGETHGWANDLKW